MMLAADIEKKFKNSNKIRIDDLFVYFKKKFPNLSDEAIHWRIHNLKDEGSLQSLGRGLYALTSDKKKKKFIPRIDKSLKQLFVKTRKQYPYARFCVWSVRWLLDYMVHLPAIDWKIIEVEKDVTDSVLSFYRSSKKNVYMNPTEKEISGYMIHDQDCLVIKNLVSEAPVETVQNIVVPTLEKILADLFVDQTLFMAYQGGEIVNIYKNIFDRYQIKYSTLRRYADRRGKKKELISFIKKEINLEI